MAGKEKFLMSGRRHLGYCRNSNLTVNLFLRRDFKSLCKISCKSVQNDRVMAVKEKVQNGGRRHLGFCPTSNLTANVFPGRDFESLCISSCDYVQK